MNKTQRSIEKEKITLNVRREEYIGCIQNYGLYAILLLLDEYEKQEEYMECHYIIQAVEDYHGMYAEDFEGLPLVTTVKGFLSEEYQTELKKHKKAVNKTAANYYVKEIKTKYPIKHEK